MGKTMFAVAAVALGLSAAPGHAAPETGAVSAQEPVAVECPVDGNGRHDTLYRLLGPGETVAVDRACRILSLGELADRGLVVGGAEDGRTPRFEFKR